MTNNSQLNQAYTCNVSSIKMFPQKEKENIIQLYLKALILMQIAGETLIEASCLDLENLIFGLSVDEFEIM